MFTPLKIVEEPMPRASADAEDSLIELCLPGLRRLIVRRGFDRQLLLDLLDLLDGRGAVPEARS